MAQCTYTTKDVLSMLDEDSEDDFEGYIDEEEYADRYENSDAETESSGNSDNEEEMEEDISEIASADEMEVNNETLNDSIDSSLTTVGPSFTATPGPIRDMSYKNPIDFFRLMIPDSILEDRQICMLSSFLRTITFDQDQEHKCGIPCSTISQN